MFKFLRQNYLKTGLNNMEQSTLPIKLFIVKILVLFLFSNNQKKHKNSLKIIGFQADLKFLFKRNLKRNKKVLVFFFNFLKEPA
jgi:hypothetical protein